MSAEEEKRRLQPVVEALVAEGMTVSVDTMRAEIAADLAGRGAQIVNDVSGGASRPGHAGHGRRPGGPLRVDALAWPQAPRWTRKLSMTKWWRRCVRELRARIDQATDRRYRSSPVDD